MIQAAFAGKARKVLQDDLSIIGLAVAGSWLTNEVDEFSDLDLILVTKEKISGDKALMLAYADRLGNLLSGFTGEHVGEPRVLICLYDDPLLHVDIKFLTLDEVTDRVENPHLLIDRDGQLKQILERTEAHFPHPDYQWIEDRYWIWIHYVLLKIGRGEYMEAVDFFSFLRMVVLGPLLHIKNGNLPRAVRKVETSLPDTDFRAIVSTVPAYERQSIVTALKNSIELYRSLRLSLFTPEVTLHTNTEMRVMEYLTEIEMKA